MAVSITPTGKALVDSAPSPLQEQFAQRLAPLSSDEPTIICVTLSEIVRMMGGEEQEAAPVLSASPADLSGTEMVGGLFAGEGDARWVTIRHD